MLLTRSPLSPRRFYPKIKPSEFVARLACVRHAASVHPEPGSNPQRNFMRSEYLQLFKEHYLFLQGVLYLLKYTLSRVLLRLTPTPKPHSQAYYYSAGGAGVSAPGGGGGGGGVPGISIPGGVTGAGGLFGIACLIMKKSATRIIIIRITTPAGLLFFPSAIFIPPFFFYFLNLD